MSHIAFFAFLVFTASCSSGRQAHQPSNSPGDGAAETPRSEVSEAPLASVTGVKTSGDNGSYQFQVTLRSPDKGCAQYADWWEVVRGDGTLVYRRVLGHSHVDEQPFTRSGGPVAITAEEVVVVRAHMNPGGYGGQAMRGSVKQGFATAPDVSADFAPSLSTTAPLPDSCAF